MKETEYILKGTPEEIINILQKDFMMSRNEAKFFVFTMANCQSDDSVGVTASNRELETWYLEEDSDSYAGQIPHTHLVINFSNTIKGICHMAYNFLVQYFFKQQIDVITVGADLVYHIVTSIQKIPDQSYCVYARIIELCIGNKERLINFDEIKTANRDGKCDYLDPKWKCPYLGNIENCNCTNEDIQKALNDLAAKNVLKQVGTRWKLA